MPNTAIVSQYIKQNTRQKKQDTIEMDTQAIFIRKMIIKKQLELCDTTRSNLVF